MKKVKSFILFLIISAIIVSSAFSLNGCSKKPALSLENGKYKLDTEVYELIVSLHKTELYNTFRQMISSAGEDLSLYDLTSYNFWNSNYEFLSYIYPDDTRTLAQIVRDEAINTSKHYLVSEKLFDEYGLEMTKDDYSSIDSSIETFEKSLKANGTNMKDYLAGYNISVSTYKKFVTYQYKTSKLLTKLLSPGGEYEVTDKMVKDSFEKTVETLRYSNVNHVFLYSVTFDQNGNQKELSEEDYLIVKKQAENIYNAIISATATFEDFLEYSNDKYSPNGYLVNVDTEMSEEFVNAAIDMDIGEVRLVETEGVGFHIIKKFELSEENKTEIEDVIKEEFEKSAEEKILNTYFDDVVVYEEVISEIDPVYAQLMI